MSAVLGWAALALAAAALGGYGAWALQQDNLGTAQQRRGLACLVAGLLLLGGGVVAAVVLSVPPVREAPPQAPPPDLVTRLPREAPRHAPAEGTVTR